MKKSLFFCALAGLAFASCSNDSETAAGNDSQIKLQASLQQVNTITRAPFLNDPSLTNPLTADILIANAFTDFAAANLRNTGALAATFTSSNGPGLTTACMWPSNADTPLYFVGLAPTGAWGASTATTTVATADGFTDLMTASATGTKNDGTVRLRFKHAQILVKLYVRAENATAKSDWGDLLAASSLIKSVNFIDQTVDNDVDIPEVMTLTLATSNIVASNSTNAGFNFKTIDATKVQETYTDVAAANLVNANLYYDRETAFGYVMLPISSGISLKSLIVQLESSNGAVGMREARIDMSDVSAAPGSACSIHLTLKENGRITFDHVTVTQWSVVSNPTGTIGG